MTDGRFREMAVESQLPPGMGRLPGAVTFGSGVWVEFRVSVMIIILLDACGCDIVMRAQESHRDIVGNSETERVCVAVHGAG